MKKEYMKLFFAGMLSSFPFSFIPFPPLTIIGFCIFFKELSLSVCAKNIVILAFFFGFGYNLFGMHWIFFPFTFDKNLTYLAPIAPIIFASFFALFICFSSLFVYLIIKKPLVKKHVYLSSVLIASFFYTGEFLRSQLFGGFPWNLYGHIWSFSESFLGIVKYIGIFGLSFLTILWIVLVSQKILLKKFKDTVILLLIFPAFLLFTGISNEEKTSGSIKVRVVQPNIPQDKKWSREHMKYNMNKLIKLSFKEKGSPSLIIWPEVAVPESLNKSKGTIEYLSKLLPKETYLLLGSLRIEDKKIFNSSYLLSNKGIINHYDKLKLVPFGEFIPFRDFFSFKKITEGKRDFSSGVNRKIMPIKVKKSILKIEPSICYEGIFPQKRINNLESNVLINITNDAWFGKTTGPSQHLTATRFRSIERGLPLIRVANSGISAIYNGNGKLLDSIPLNQEGYIDFDLKISHLDTIYSNYGDKTLIVIFLIVLFLAIFLDFFSIKKRLNN